MQSTDNKRLFIAVAVSMAVLLLWQLFFAPQPPVPEESEAQQATESQGDTDAAEPGHDGATPRLEADVPADAPSLGPAKIPPRLATLETDAYRLVITNVGARAAGFAIKVPERYAEHTNYFASVLDEVDAAVPEGTLPLVTSFKTLPLGSSAAFEVIEENTEHVLLRWVSADGAVTIDKDFRPGAMAFGVDLDVTISNRGQQPIDDSVDLGLFNRSGEDDEPGFFGVGRPITASCLTDDGVERVTGDDEAESYDVDVQWIAVDEPYFVTIAHLDGGAKACRIGAGDGGLIEASLQAEVNVLPGETQLLEYKVYFGPKEAALLDTFGHEAYRTVDYGWFEFLARPIAWLLGKLFGLMGNWGLAIILLTIIIRGALWPVTQRSQESMMRMKDVSPQIKELQEKYKSDPSMLQQKQMELFREHNVSPLGCLPLVLQIPIWLALYRTILATAELYKADFGFWIHDLSAPDPFYILPVVAGALFFLQQKLSPTSVTDVKQKVLMTVFPLVFVVVMLFLPSGLNLYILMSSVIGVAQVLYTQRKTDKAKAAKASPTTNSDSEEARGPSSSQERRAERRRKGRN